MRRSGGTEVLLGVIAGALFLLGTVVQAQPPGSIPPVYTQRLRMPVRGDDFAQPRAVVADLHTGEIFVCDSLRNRIVIFDRQGRFRYQIPGGSTFQSPIDLAVDPDGYLFVLSQVSVDIVLLDFDGRLIRRVPLTGLPDGADSARFSSLALSPSGESLYVMDSQNDRVWITNRDGVIQGSIDMTVGRPQEEIDQLRYGHVDIYGDTVLVPVPTDGLVHLFDLQGHAKGTIGAQGAAECQTMFPTAAALDDEGRVIILDQQRALFMTWDLARGVCLSEHYGFGNAPGAFYQPSDLALDAAGRLYVSQGFEGRVQVYEGARPASLRVAARQLAPEARAESPIAAAGKDQAETAQEPMAVEEPTVATRPAPTPAAAEPAPVDEPVVATTEVESHGIGALLDAGARQSVERAPHYDPTYVEIVYPGGDPPSDRGAAVDVVIRAFRHAGIDLQQAVHEDVLDAPDAYAIRELDPNIDHRRIRNLLAFFQRKAASLPTEHDGDWAAGDIVFWDRDADGTAGHVGVVTAQTGPSGELLVVHHHRPEGEFAETPVAEDVLFRWPIVGHYRWLVEASTQVAARKPSPGAPVESSIVAAGKDQTETAQEPTAVEEPAVATRPAPASPVAEPAPVEEPVVATTEVESHGIGALLDAGARRSVERAPHYDPTYVEIVYPGGDPPSDRGAAVDVVIRAFRHAGIDLQQAVHEDVLDAPGAYAIRELDPNIDHRRIRNLFAFFQRKAASLPTEHDGDWAAGDIVFWDRNADGTAGHIGVVTAQTGPSGELLVVHHHRPEGEFAGTPVAEDVLFRWPMVGHYRWLSRAEDR